MCMENKMRNQHQTSQGNSHFYVNLGVDDIATYFFSKHPALYGVAWPIEITTDLILQHN